jgi:hypothetical protein
VLKAADGWPSKEAFGLVQYRAVEDPAKSVLDLGESRRSRLFCEVMILIG